MRCQDSWNVRQVMYWVEDTFASLSEKRCSGENKFFVLIKSFKSAWLIISAAKHDKYCCLSSKFNLVFYHPQFEALAGHVNCQHVPSTHTKLYQLGIAYYAIAAGHEVCRFEFSATPAVDPAKPSWLKMNFYENWVKIGRQAMEE